MKSNQNQDHRKLERSLLVLTDEQNGLLKLVHTKPERARINVWWNDERSNERNLENPRTVGWYIYLRLSYGVVTRTGRSLPFAGGCVHYAISRKYAHALMARCARTRAADGLASQNHSGWLYHLEQFPLCAHNEPRAKPTIERADSRSRRAFLNNQIGSTQHNRAGYISVVCGVERSVPGVSLSPLRTYICVCVCIARPDEPSNHPLADTRWLYVHMYVCVYRDERGG